MAGRLTAVILDPIGADPAHPLIVRERSAAIRDLSEGASKFQPAGRTDGSYRLRLSLSGRYLVLDVEDAESRPVARHMLSLTPLNRLIQDYFLVCESHISAIGKTTPDRVEAFDMGRRSVHNEGAAVLRDRLAGKIDVDLATARRLFTLVCALRWKG
ncbi:MAG TPA: UPF0262 family protein [Bauldia sp.]|nr:UPF0262 family protein [Bauldia sp.]